MSDRDIKTIYLDPDHDGKTIIHWDDDAGKKQEAELSDPPATDKGAIKVRGYTVEEVMKATHCIKQAVDNLF